MRRSLPILVSVLFLSFQYPTQDRYAGAYICDKGKIHFYASTPIEDIEATTNNAFCVINIQTRKISAKVQMATFQFRRSKMQEDFNEDYAESAKFPDAVLEVSIVNKVNFSVDGQKEVTLKGTMEIHGTKKDIELTGKLTIKNGKPVSAIAKFDIALVDYNFKIPTIVIAKIATVVNVDVNFEFRKYEKV